MICQEKSLFNMQIISAAQNKSFLHSQGLKVNTCFMYEIFITDIQNSQTHTSRITIHCENIKFKFANFL